MHSLSKVWAGVIACSLISYASPALADLVGLVVENKPDERVILGGSCQTAADCDDGISCTVDSCIDGSCGHVVNHLLCNDGLSCNGFEFCNQGGCGGVILPSCGAGQYCDEDANACVSFSNCCTPNDAAGCDNTFCQSVICALAPECCTDSWNMPCAALASTNCGGSCSPGPIGLVVTENTTPSAAAAGLVTYNLYVQLNHPDVEVFGVGSSTITTNDQQGFYQHPLGSNTPPNAVLCVWVPSLALLCSDSFVTIGKQDSTGDTTAWDSDFYPGVFNCNPAIAPCPGGLPPGLGGGGWFNPAVTQNDNGAPDENLQVLIAQLTVRSGFDVFGQMFVLMAEGDNFYLFSFTTACPPDLNDDGVTDAGDLALLLGAWGPNADHPADLNADGRVDAADLAQLLGNWGPCT